MRNLKIIFFISIYMCVNAFSAVAQNVNIDSAKLTVPGPANQDTTKFATFYVMRPHNEIAQTLWMGIYFDDALMVRVNDGMRYAIKYPKAGNVSINIKNDQISQLTINAEPGKKYYLQLNSEAGGKTGSTKLVQMDDDAGAASFNAIKFQVLYIYDPDPFINSYYVYPSSPGTGYSHMKFSAPLSTRHFFQSALNGFQFTYYNKLLSQTFSEVDGVYGSKINFSDKDDFENFFDKQVNNLKKGFKKSETLQEMTTDTLTSAADYTSAVYYVTKDTKPNVLINGQPPVLELRSYNAIVFYKSPATGKGDYYTIAFSERGLPEELHTKEEIRFKIQQLLNSCEFGDFKE